MIYLVQKELTVDRFLLLTVAKGGKSMTNRAKLWYVPVNQSEKVMDVPPMPYKSSEQEAIGQDVYEEQKAFRSRNADLPASFSRDTPGAGNAGINNFSFASLIHARIFIARQSRY